MSRILAAATAHLSDITNDIADLVGIETHSSDKDALRAGADHVRELVERRLGPPAECRLHDGGDRGDILDMTYPGDAEGTVLILAHFDTVWPTGTLAEIPFVQSIDSDGRSVLTGPGVFDMKTGLVQGIWALKLLIEDGGERPTVRFVFNGDEETGSISSRPVIEEAATTADAVLVLEPTSGGAVKTGRKGVGIFTIDATGIEAHAGLDPAAGASAVHALAEFVTRATRIADPGRGTSVNVGLISGGTGTNVSAGSARAVVDIRITSDDERRRVDDAFDRIRWSDDRVTIAVEHGWNRPPMNLSDTNRALLGVVESAALRVGRRLEHTAVGGASDANFVAALDVPVVCGMGAVGGGAHARHEFAYVDEIPIFTALTAETIGDLAGGLTETAH